jgi:hypothetical protein
LAQSVFEGETTSIELAFKIRERVSLMALTGTLGEAMGQADDKPKAILKVTHFRFRHDPRPIQSPVSQHKPGQCLDESRLEVVLGERSEKDLAWIFGFRVPGAQVSEPRVFQASEVPG